MASDLAIVIGATNPENIGQIVEVLGAPTGLPVNATWECITWQVRTVSGRRSLLYRFGSGPMEMVMRHAEGPVPDFRLRPLPGVEAIHEQGRAGERDVADGMFTPGRTQAFDEAQ